MLGSFIASHLLARRYEIVWSARCVLHLTTCEKRIVLVSATAERTNVFNCNRGAPAIQ